VPTEVHARRTKRLTAFRSGMILLAVFLGFLMLHISLLSVPYLRDEIGSDSMNQVALKFAAMYSVHMSVILAGLFNEHSREKSLQRHAKLFHIALWLAIIWNLLITWRCSLFLIISLKGSRLAIYWRICRMFTKNSLS
jgi:hypothetical protein